MHLNPYKNNCMIQPITLRPESTAVFFQSMLVTSPAFKPGGSIPMTYTCEGKNINPPMDVEGCPADAVSLAIVVDDPDAPIGTWSHWIAWNIPVTKHIRSNHLHGEEGLNDFLHNQYDGPCPHQGTHEYRFKVYALDCILQLPATTRQKDLEKSMAGHILAFGELTGTYQKQINQ
jgi:Raf kinase inhibitor-like YbhB/YbcL family protein